MFIELIADGFADWFFQSNHPFYQFFLLILIHYERHKCLYWWLEKKMLYWVATTTFLQNGWCHVVGMSKKISERGIKISHFWSARGEIRVVNINFADCTTFKRFGHIFFRATHYTITLPIKHALGKIHGYLCYWPICMLPNSLAIKNMNNIMLSKCLSMITQEVFALKFGRVFPIYFSLYDSDNVLVPGRSYCQSEFMLKCNSCDYCWMIGYIDGRIFWATLSIFPTS